MVLFVTSLLCMFFALWFVFKLQFRPPFFSLCKCGKKKIQFFLQPLASSNFLVFFLKIQYLFIFSLCMFYLFFLGVEREEKKFYFHFLWQHGFSFYCLFCYIFIMIFFFFANFFNYKFTTLSNIYVSCVGPKPHLHKNLSHIVTFIFFFTSFMW